jgi:hypothetical protein
MHRPGPKSNSRTFLFVAIDGLLPYIVSAPPATSDGTRDSLEITVLYVNVRDVHLYGETPKRESILPLPLCYIFPTPMWEQNVAGDRESDTFLHVYVRTYGMALQRYEHITSIRFVLGHCAILYDCEYNTVLPNTR